MRLGIFIDGSNLHSSVKELGEAIDFSSLLEYAQNWGQLIRASYYTALPNDGEYSSVIPMIDYLSYNGWLCVTKPTKSFDNPDGTKKVKGNMDVEIAVDVMELAHRLDHIVLFSGDGDFTCLLRAVQRQGCRVTIVSTLKVTADDLRRQTDNYIELKDILPFVRRARVEN